MDYTLEQLEQSYYEITDLYDLADELVDTVEHKQVSNPAEQLAIIQPLVEEVGDAADVLAEEFIAIAENKGKGKPKNKNKIESALRSMYAAIEGYNTRVKAGVEHAVNVADPIVKKIKRQIEMVVATLIDFVELSLDRIMQRSQLEEMKQHQEKIAMMLHQATQHQPG